MLNEMYATFEKFANQIPNWKSMSKNEIANLYLDYELDEERRNWYISALMCKYWHKVYDLNKTSKSANLQIDDFASWLYEAITVAFKYRAWTVPNNKLYNDPNGPDKVINRCIFSVRNKHYQEFNMQKRKSNFATDSIDRQLDEVGDSASINEVASYVEDITWSEDIVLYFIKQNRIEDAIIIDEIGYQDCFTFQKGKFNFSVVKLISNLNNLNSNYLKYFVNKYEVGKNVTKVAMSNLKNLTSVRLTHYLSQLFNEIRRFKPISVDMRKAINGK